MYGNSNIYAVLEAHFPMNRGQAVIEMSDGTTFSYEDLEEQSARFAVLLRTLEVQPGERVLAQVEKSPQALFFYLACVRAGCIFLPLNTAYQRDELAYFMDDSRPSVVVCRQASRKMIEGLARERGIGNVLDLEADGSGSLAEAAREQTARFETVRCQPVDIAAILYTSGTTGQSKGAMISHGNLASNGASLHKIWGFRAGDVLLHALPIYHVHGLFVACHCALLNGSTLLWLHKFDAGEVVRLLPRASVFMGVPTYYSRLLAEQGFDRPACRDMRLFVSGSAPLHEQTFEAFRERTGHTILERYGMTETGMNTSNPLHGVRCAGTVGLPLPGVEVRVVNDVLNDVCQGDVGQLLVRGENVFAGYWEMPEKTAAEFTADGWFMTGDLATIDTRGYVSIVGRGKDLIISGGLNVYPKEVERVIDELPGVRESAVIGLSHPDFGEAVAAVVVSSEADKGTDGAALIESLHGKLASFKLPKEIFFIEELPRNAMGKVQKNVLRDRYSSSPRSSRRA